MTTSAKSFPSRSVFAAAALLLGGLAATAVAAREPEDWRNATTGGPLRPGVYGRIVIKGKVAPPVIFPHPLVADGSAPVHAQAVYLYVPPGQVRKWSQNCAKWSACEEPVLFVRVDDSPSRWGHWRLLREQVALHQHD
ncbi:hypothetical protein [Ramlibacter sp.]|uniref:hypothetical protein n=1 Tax=Ramlibacter sp. TaxID=1917967 RepID=UPI002631E36A|nr:hypothetical protein [Ramlibacter sp.]MDB5955345.1 hypothetical protein [Ramlibacter sp.]